MKPIAYDEDLTPEQFFAIVGYPNTAAPERDKEKVMKGIESAIQNSLKTPVRQGGLFDG